MCLKGCIKVEKGNLGFYRSNNMNFKAFFFNMLNHKA